MAAGPDSLESGRPGESGLGISVARAAWFWGKDRRGRQGRSQVLCVGGKEVASVLLVNSGGVYWLNDTPRPHTSQSKTTWRVLSPDSENRGGLKTQPSPLLGLRGGAP